MNNITPFNFKGNEVRTLMIDNEPWFVANDVAKTLEYTRPRKAVQDHVDSDDKDCVPIQDAMGRIRQTNVVNESGMYSLILSSKLPSAREFKRWVTSEVLPEIRKTGSFSVDVNQASYMIEDPAARARRWAEEFEERKKLAASNKKLQSKADSYDATLSDEGVMPIGELAKYIEQKLNLNGYTAHVGRNNFFKYLRKNGYLIKSGAEYNMPTASAMRLKLFKVVQVPIKKAGWIDTLKSITRATPKAKAYFLSKAEEIVEMD